MGFHVLHLQRMLFFWGTMIFICTSADEFDEDESNILVKPGPRRISVQTVITDPSVSILKVNYEEMPKKHLFAVNLDHKLVFHLLSPDILSKVDPLQYMIRETANIATWKLREIYRDLGSHLKNNQISEIYIPYAEALRTVLRFQVAVQNITRDIQRNISDGDRFIIPAEISSPAAFSTSGLFSRDIFYDLEAPIQLFNTLIRIPKSDIPNLINELENYIKLATKWINAPYRWWRYKSYASELLEILKSDMLDDLDLNMNDIRRISTISRQSSGATGSNNAT